MLTRPAPDALAFSTDSGLLEAKALRVFRIAPAALIQLAAAIGVEERENGGRERGVDLRNAAALPHRGTAPAARPNMGATPLVAGRHISGSAGARRTGRPHTPQPPTIDYPPRPTPS